MANQNKGEFKDPGEALQRLGQDFAAWGEILTTHSIQLAYAIIAANWAVHGSTQDILKNDYAKASLVIVFLFLGLNILSSGLLAHMHFQQYLHGEADGDRWKREFEESLVTRRTFWPYTKGIERLGVVSRFGKIWAPTIAALLFILSLFS